MAEESETKETLYSEYNLPLREALSSLMKEYKEDTKVNRTNLGDVVMMVPAIKAKWVARHVEYQNAEEDTQLQLAKELKKAVEKIRKESQCEITKVAAEKKAREEFFVLSVLDERISLLGRLKNACWEIVDKHLKYFNNEIQCMIEFSKLEQL